MKNIMTIFGALLFASTILTSCGNNKQDNSSKEPSKQSDESTNSNSPTQQKQTKEIQIAGTYSGTDNVGMESTIILRSGGTLIIQASVGDGTPDYGNWTGTADNLSLYHKDAFGNDELIGNAKVTDEGLRIIGGKFYARQ
jgi:hypothetical protein